MHKKIMEILSKYDISQINSKINQLKDIKVLMIGDAIIDEYTFVIPKGRAIKDPMLSCDFVRSEIYPGGILTIANTVSEFIQNASLITLLGEKKEYEDFIKEKLPKNISIKFFYKKDSPTIIKKRYVDEIRKHKLFKIEYINDKPVETNIENDIIKYLQKELPKYDLVILGDFGHGFITENIARTIEKYSKHLAANVQTNSTNFGFNYITKYKKVDYITSNETELRLAFCDRLSNPDTLIEKMIAKQEYSRFLITQGSAGLLYVKDKKKYTCPGFTNKVQDIVGAGDQVLLFGFLADMFKK